VLAGTASALAAYGVLNRHGRFTGLSVARLGEVAQRELRPAVEAPEDVHPEQRQIREMLAAGPARGAIRDFERVGLRTHRPHRVTLVSMIGTTTRLAFVPACKSETPSAARVPTTGESLRPTAVPGADQCRFAMLRECLRL